MKEIRLLVVPDAYDNHASGAKACRKFCFYFKQLVSCVGVFAVHTGTDGVELDSEIEFFHRSVKSFAGYNHVLSAQAGKEFECVITQFKPTHVFFLGQAYNKPAVYYRVCDKLGIKRIHFFWQQDFFCQNGYACLKNGPCRKCLEDRKFIPFGLDCTHGASSLKGRLQIWYRCKNIQRMQKYFLNADKVMGTGKYHLESYRMMGIRDEQIVECPLPFEHNLVNHFPSTKGDYFLCYGQNIYEKGWEYLLELLDEADSGIKIVFPFTSGSADEHVDSLGLQKYIEKGVLEIKTGITWQNGVEELLAGALGVLLPSVWPTTTEYTFLESIGYGKPIFAWNVGVNQEFIVTGENGFIATFGDVSELLGYMERLRGEAALYDEISEKSIQLFERITDDHVFMEALSRALR